jgi:hypothetical protein
VRRTELATAVALVVAGLATLAVLVPRYVVDAGVASALSPRFMPYVAALLATGAALQLLLEALVRRGDAAGAGFGRGSLRFLGASAAVLGTAYLLMSLAGYLVGGAALVAGMLLLGRAKPATIVVAAVLAPVALWLVFAELLATPLP